jgi:hypothetical protein
MSSLESACSTVPPSDQINFCAGCEGPVLASYTAASRTLTKVRFGPLAPRWAVLRGFVAQSLLAKF